MKVYGTGIRCQGWVRVIIMGVSVRFPTDPILNLFSYFLALVHISVDLRRRAGDDGGLPLPAQTAHRLHQEGQQRRLPGQSRRSLGSGSGDRASAETGDASHIHTSSCRPRLVAVATADLSLRKCTDAHKGRK